MATEKSRLITANINEKKQYSINTELDSGEAKNIRQILADIKAGRVRIGPVLLYTLIAVIGSLSLGFILGYSSLTEYSLKQTGNYTHKRFHVDLNFIISDQNYSYFGVSNNSLSIKFIYLFRPWLTLQHYLLDY